MSPRPCPFCGVEIHETPILGSEKEKVLVHEGNNCVLELCRIPKDKIAAWNTRTPATPSPEIVEKVARAIDPDAWKQRDEDLQRREEWEAGIKVGWGDTTFEEWVNRFVGKSLEQATAALSAIGADERWQPIESAPKDGTWLLLRGRNSVDAPMIPVVCAWTSLGGSGPAWRDSGSLRDMGMIITDVPAGSSADWCPLPPARTALASNG